MARLKPVAIVTLSKYIEFFQDFKKNMEQYAPGVPKILVRDGEEIPLDILSDFTVLLGSHPFEIAKNINKGWQAVPPDHDIFFVSDDIRFTAEETVETVQQVAYSDPQVGILSPRLVGRGSYPLCNPTSTLSETNPLELWYPCPYIKREVIEAIGYFDEGFPFGRDDADYNLRAVNHGYKLAVTNAVSVIHLETADGISASARKTYDLTTIKAKQSVGDKHLGDKYGPDFQYLVRTSWSQRKADGRL